MTRRRILIAEDSPSLALGYAAQLEEAGYEVILGETLAEARAALAESDIDLILLDLQLPDGDGLELLRAGEVGGAVVIVITADGSLSRAIGAMRLGAFDFLVKPVGGGRLLSTVKAALDQKTKPSETRVGSRPAERSSAAVTAGDFHGFIGKSPVMLDIYRTIERIASSRASVFVTGESGTGKEVTAEAIHAESGRKGAFVAVNCGAIPENLMESELFGHVKGAFTGAIENRIGAAKAADMGTLFLDEICELDLKLQVKLLRFLQSSTITRVGSSKAEAVDVRIVCATNRNVEREVAEGHFREDLYYRLNVIPLRLPALRERGDDVVRIASALVHRIGAEENRPDAVLSANSLASLGRHTWSGNVRELQNAIRRAVITPGQGAIDVASSSPLTFPVVSEKAEDDRTLKGEAAIREDAPPRSLAQIERTAIENAIARARGNICEAARELEISPSTIYRKIERWHG